MQEIKQIQKTLTCRSCFYVGDSPKFVRGNIIKGLYAVCKKCRSDNSKNKIMNAKAEENPKDYMQCNDCDRVFNKYQGRPREGRMAFFKTYCKFCLSENIEEYYA